MHTESLMRPDMIVLLKPRVDDDPSLVDRCKPFGIQYFSAQCSIEPFIVPVFPRRAGIDLDWFDTDLCQPVLQSGGDKLRAIVGADVFRLPVFEQKWVKRFEHISRAHASLHMHT